MSKYKKEEKAPLMCLLPLCAVSGEASFYLKYLTPLPNKG